MSMHKIQHLRSQDKRAVTQRAIVILSFITFFMLVLLARVAYLQIIDHQKYATLSNRNQMRLVDIPASRGLIYDRHGKLLARNVPAFQLAINPEQVQDLPKTLEELSKIIPISKEQRQACEEKVAHNPSHQTQTLKLKLSEEDVSRFSVNQYRFPGVNLAVNLIRDYPYGELLAHVIGYVSEANKEDLLKTDKKHHSGTYQIGKTGLEKHYEQALQGQPGYQQMETDVLGREVRVISTYPAISGADLHLTLDLELQKAARKALGENRGAVIALDPNNGEILAFVSTPSFDPNLFVRGLDNASYEALARSPDRPLFNRIIQGQYPPASTVKPILALAGIETQQISPQQKIFCHGSFQLKGNSRVYNDMKRDGHGWTTVEKSIRESCDVFYYMLAEKLTISGLSTWLSSVGLGKATGVDLPGEQKGLVPSAAWKRKTQGTTWYPGETIISGIGQGYLLATPIQLAVAGSYIANRGQAFKPHLNKALTPQKLAPFNINHPDNWSIIIESMHQVVQHPQGTGYRYFKGVGFDAAGKSGTAQVYGLKAHEKYEHHSVASHLRDHSLFIAFAPKEQPKIVVAVVLEHQRASALVAREVLEAYLTGNQEHALQASFIPS